MAHLREAARDRRGTVAALVAFGAMVLGVAALDLLLAGGGRAASEPGAAGAGVVQAAFPTIALIGFSGIAFAQTAVPLARYRANGVLRVLGTTPASRLLFLAAYVPVRAGVGALQIAALVLLLALFGPESPETLPETALLLCSGMLLMLALGTLAGARCRDPDRAAGWGFITTLLLLACSGTTIPFTALPDGLAAALAWVPTTALARGLAASLAGVPGDLPAPAVSLALVALACGLFAWAARVFTWGLESEEPSHRTSAGR